MVDLYIAFSIIAIVVVVFFLSRLKVLPGKSLPFVAGALLGVFGLSLFQSWRQKKIKARIKEKEEEIKRMEQELQALRSKHQISEASYFAALAEFTRQKEAYQKTLLLIGAKNKAEKERIDKLAGDELVAEFNRAFGS